MLGGLPKSESPRERAPMSITVRRFRQWVGGVELTFDPRCEAFADFTLRYADNPSILGGEYTLSGPGDIR